MRRRRSADELVETTERSALTYTVNGIEVLQRFAGVVGNFLLLVIFFDILEQTQNGTQTQTHKNKTRKFHNPRLTRELCNKKLENYSVVIGHCFPVLL